jgi:phage terminase large subunit-like protein
VARFIEGFCRPSKGAGAGQLVQLLPWQHQLLADMFVLREDGTRRYRTAYVGVAKKNGKSTGLGSPLALYGLCMDKEPGAEVYSVARDRQQARVVFDEARYMVEADPELNARLRTFRYHIEDPVTHSIYRVLSSDAKGQHGLNPSWVVFDEIWAQPDTELWTAMKGGMVTRRQPFLFAITTAGWDRTSLAWQLYDHGRRVQAGEVDDPSFFYRWWEPSDPGCAIDDEAAWREANPSYGTIITREALQSDLSLPENEFRQFHLNQWTDSAAAWLPYGAWSKIEAAVPVGEGTPVVLGFDGSWTNDSTALVGCTVTERPHLFVVDCWERPATDPGGWVVPSHEVDEALYRAMGAYDVLEVACDPYYWREQLARWMADDLPILEWPTNSVARMVPACRQFYTAVVEERISHDGDPRLARHISNTTVKTDVHGARIVKQSAAQKIDLAVAATIALDRAMYHGSGITDSVYDKRGFRTWDD